MSSALTKTINNVNLIAVNLDKFGLKSISIQKRLHIYQFGSVMGIRIKVLKRRPVHICAIKVIRK